MKVSFSFWISLLSFVLFATIAIFMLFGYRFNSQTFTFEKTGVIHIQGTYKETIIRLLGKDITKDLPTVLTDIPLGEHEIEIEKKGYYPIKKKVLITESRVYDVPVHFVPKLELVQKQRTEPLNTPAHYFPNIRAVLQYSEHTIELYNDITSSTSYATLALPQNASHETFVQLDFLKNDSFLLTLRDGYYVLSPSQLLPLEHKPFEKIFAVKDYIFYTNENTGTISYMKYPSNDIVVLATGVQKTNTTVITFDKEQLPLPVYSYKDAFVFIDLQQAVPTLTPVIPFENSPHTIYIFGNSIYYLDSTNTLRGKGKEALLGSIQLASPQKNRVLFLTSAKKLYQLYKNQIEFLGDVQYLDIWNITMDSVHSLYYLHHYNGITAFDVDNMILYPLFVTKTPLDVSLHIMSHILIIEDYANATRHIYDME